MWSENHTRIQQLISAQYFLAEVQFAHDQLAIDIVLIIKSRLLIDRSARWNQGSKSDRGMIHVISSYHVMLIAWTSAARRCVQEHNPRILQASGRQNKTRRLHPETNSIRSRHLRGRDNIRMGIISVQAHQRRMRKDVNIRGLI